MQSSACRYLKPCGCSLSNLTLHALFHCVVIMAFFAVCRHGGGETVEVASRDGQARSMPQREIIYEGLVSYGNYRLFGAAENAKLYAAGVEYNREFWPNLFHTRVDGVVEILPVLLLTQPQKTDIWGNPLTRERKIVPGAGVTPIGLRFLWRDGKEIMPYFEVKGSVLGFTQKALSSEATYENWSFHLSQGVKVRLRGRYDLRLGLLSDLHFSNAFVVRSNPALDVMNVDVGLVYHLGSLRKKY
jgi:Lipid A 3-O-deacylase (PagL)